MSAERRRVAHVVTRRHGNIRGYFAAMYAAEAEEVARDWRDAEERWRDIMWECRASELDSRGTLVAGPADAAGREG